MITANPSQFVRVDEQDPAFRMTDGIVVRPRAAIEIDEDCSVELSQMLIEAMNRGLIRAVAYVHKNDYLADQLKR
jgi:hypothetical protein